MNLYKYGIGFDGSSVRGFADINESDLMLFPDKLTSRIITDKAHLIPDPEKPHFSKLFDIHMMCVSSGKERTADEYSILLQRSGWKYSQILHPRYATGMVQ